MQKFNIAVGENRKSIDWKNTLFTWEDFLKKLSTPIRTNETYEQFKGMSPTQQGKLKDVGGFVAGTVKNSRRKAENIVDRCMVTLDADHIEPGKTDKVIKAVESLNCTYCVYSTRNHTAYKPRLRIIIPLDKAVTPDEYEPIARKIASLIDMQIMDKTTFEASRLMYWPNCSSDSEYVFVYKNRGLADGHGILGMYKNWQDCNEWPKAQDEETIIKKTVKKLGDPREKNKTVGAFCNIYDIHQAIATFLTDVYESGDNPNAYHHIGSTAGYSAVVYDDGLYMYSYHATDPACKKCCNSFDLVRIHKFGHLDDTVQDGVSGSALPSYKAMCQFVNELPEMREYKRQKALEDFKNNPEEGLSDLFFENGKFQIPQFCKYLIENEHIHLINNQLCIYDNGVYVAKDELIQRKMINLIPGLLENKRNECLKYIRLLVGSKNVSDNKNYIAFNNGIFNIETQKLENHNPNIIVTNLIPYNYNPNAYSELVDSVLNKITCNDNELRALLEEMTGYMFFRSNIYAKSFFLLGTTSNNGKSVFLNLLKSVLGTNNYSAIAYENLDERFKTAEIAGKLANIGDDCSQKFNSGSAIFKKLSTGETIVVERKGKDPFGFENYATMIFSFNKMPRTDDKSQATAKKRMCIIPFNAVFKKTDPDFDPKINEKLKAEECLEYIILLGINGLLRLIKRGYFIEPTAVRKINDDYEEFNNPIITFLKEKEEKGYNIEDFKASEVYQQYKCWCINNGLEQTSITNFGVEMKQLGYEKVQRRIGDERRNIYTRKVGDK